MKMKLPSGPFRTIFAGFLAVGLLAAAGDPPSGAVVARRGDVTITASDLHDALNRIDPAVRAQILGNSAALANLARERLINKALLAEANSKGWDQKPEIVQRINDARDAVILQAYTESLAAADPAFPSDAQIAAAYEANKTRLMLPRQYHLAQIVLTVPNGASKEADEAVRRKLAELRTQAARPKADFAEIARKTSQDHPSAEHGGEVGWVREDQLLPAVKAAVATLRDNELSEPVRAPDGWHLLRLLGTRAPAPAPLAEAKPLLVQSLRQEHAQQAVRAHVDEMLHSAPIEVNEIDLQRSAAAPH
jgi:parvulin-like peptidyl-prolyl isomerase